jgi:hypothetical protein
MFQSSPATSHESPLAQSIRTPAVQRCRDARDRSLLESRAMNLSESKTRDRAQDAYVEAMPDLAGYHNIRDFIACVSAGVLSGDISPIHSPGLLYAAQVAISALRLEPKDKGPKDKARPA